MLRIIYAISQDPGGIMQFLKYLALTSILFFIGLMLGFLLGWVVMK